MSNGVYVLLPVTSSSCLLGVFSFRSILDMGLFDRGCVCVSAQMIVLLYHALVVRAVNLSINR